MPGEVFTKAPFGERIKTSDREEPYPDETEDGFTGKDFDEDIGLYYYNARFYDPEIGRFITEDSVIDPNNQGNAYVYVANNPVNNIDPTGHSLSSLFSTLGKINQALNLAAELDPNLKGLASAFDSFAGALSNVRDFVMGAKEVFGQKNIKVTKDKVIVNLNQ
ncbi:MAG: RHS repeat-associated core domain-containing protein [Bacillota bacterium]